MHAITDQLQDALNDCDRSLRLLPTNKNAYDSRGFTYLKMGKFDAAIADYEKALALDPNLATSLYGRGLARLKKGDSKGDDDIKQAQQHDPDIAKTFSSYGL